MKSPELPPNSDNLLQDSVAWQEVLEGAPNNKARQQMATIACSSLNELEGYLGANRVVVKSKTAYVVSVEKREQDHEGLLALQFGSITARGHLGKVEYIDINQGGVLSWSVYDAEIWNTQEVLFDVENSKDWGEGAYLPSGRSMRLPLHLPVNLIEFALPVAR